MTASKPTRRRRAAVAAEVPAPPLVEPMQAAELTDDTDAHDAPELDAYGLPPATPETDRLIVENQDLARCYARRMALQTKFSAEDLSDAAYWGLIKAARTFDPSRGFKFSTHAVPKIVGTIQQWLRDYGYAVKFPHSWREHMPKVRRLVQSGKTAAQVVAEIGNKPNGGPILTEDDVREMLHVSRQFKHWDEVLGLDSEPRVRNAEVLEDQEFDDAEELNSLWDLAARAWRRMEPGDRQLIAAAWNAKRRHLPGLPMGQLRANLKALTGPYQVRGETELVPLGFPLERGLGAVKPARRMAAAAGTDGQQLVKVAEQLGLGI